MWKPLIKLRKITFLRLKFWKKRKKKESSIVFPSAKDFLEKADMVYENFLEAERKNDISDLNFWKGAMSITDWINEYDFTDED